MVKSSLITSKLNSSIMKTETSVKKVKKTTNTPNKMKPNKMKLNKIEKTKNEIDENKNKSESKN